MSEIKFPNTAQQLSDAAWPLGQFSLNATQKLWDQNQAIARALVEWNSDVLRFVNERMNRDYEIMGQLVQSQSWAQALDIEAQWVRRTVDDYLEETSKLIEFNSKIMGNLMEATSGVGAQQAVAKIPMKAAS